MLLHINRMVKMTDFRVMKTLDDFVVRNSAIELTVEQQLHSDHEPYYSYPMYFKLTKQYDIMPQCHIVQTRMITQWQNFFFILKQNPPAATNHSFSHHIY